MNKSRVLRVNETRKTDQCVNMEDGRMKTRFMWYLGVNVMNVTYNGRVSVEVNQGRQ